MPFDASNFEMIPSIFPDLGPPVVSEEYLEKCIGPEIEFSVLVEGLGGINACIPISASL